MSELAVKLLSCFLVGFCGLVDIGKGAQLSSAPLPFSEDVYLHNEGLGAPVVAYATWQERPDELLGSGSSLAAIEDVLLVRAEPEILPSIVVGIRIAVIDYLPGWDIDPHDSEDDSMRVVRSGFPVPVNIQPNARGLSVVGLDHSLTGLGSAPPATRSSGEMRFSEMLNRPIFLPLQTPCFRIVIKTGLQKVARGQLFQMGHYYLLGDDSRAISERRTRRWPVSFRSTAVTQQAKT